MRTATIHAFVAPIRPVGPHTQQAPLPQRKGKTCGGRSAIAALVALIAGLGFAMPGFALDLVAFTGITGPLTSALTQLSSLAPGIKALVGFIGFVVALISLSALRNFGPVLFYVGLAIFGAVGLVIAGAIMGAVV